MNKQKIGYILAGAMTLASSGFLYYQQKKKQKFEQEKKDFAKLHPIKDFELALQELKIQLYPLFFSIASMHKIYLDKEVEKTGNSPEKVKDYIQEILQPEFTKMVKQKEQLIYKKYNLNYEDVDLALNKYYKKEKNIQEIYIYIIKNVKNCTRGIPPDLIISDSTLQFATEDRVINIWKRISINNGKKLVRFYNSLKKQGIKNLTLDNIEVFSGICRLNLIEDRNFILQLEGFSELKSEDPNYKESSMDILQKCCQYYKEKNQRFAELIAKMEDIHENLVMIAMNPEHEIKEDDVDKFYDVLTQQL